jgi:uncharacterized protein (DUF1778 family)
MAILHPRMRVVMFRISDSEYELIRSACEASGARSFSDFARSAVLSQATGARPQRRTPRASANPVTELQERVRDLEQRLENLTSSLVVHDLSAAAEE